MRHQLKVEIVQETDGRWLASIPAIRGCHQYGDTPDEAHRKVVILALQIMADLAEHGEPLPAAVNHLFAAAA